MPRSILLHLRSKPISISLIQKASYRTAITNLIQRYRGRVVDSPGDNIVAEFISAADAVNGAVEIQRELAERNEELPKDRKTALKK